METIHENLASAKKDAAELANQLKENAVVLSCIHEKKYPYMVCSEKLSNLLLRYGWQVKDIILFTKA